MLDRSTAGVATVAVAACETYDLDAVRRAMDAALAPLGGMARFVRPGMRVLLKPNQLSVADWQRAVTTHPAIVQAAAELVAQAGGEVWVGDSPAGPAGESQSVLQRTGITAAAAAAGATVVPFERAIWRRLGESDYFLAAPALEADLVINLPKLKTHTLTLYTGAVKNMFGVVVGGRKRELHLRAPGPQAFSKILVDVLELARPGLTIMDGVLGQHGNGPGVGGTPFSYRLIAASSDPVALDAVLTQAMGYRPGEVLYLPLAAGRGLGVADGQAVQVLGETGILGWGRLDLPHGRWLSLVPGWAGGVASRLARVRPRLDPAACVGCGRCVEVCPRNTITRGRPAEFRLQACIGCMCCAEICPQGAIRPQRSLLARLVGMGY